MRLCCYTDRDSCRIVVRNRTLRFLRTSIYPFLKLNRCPALTREQDPTCHSGLKIHHLHVPVHAWHEHSIAFGHAYSSSQAHVEVEARNAIRLLSAGQETYLTKLLQPSRHLSIVSVRVQASFVSLYAAKPDQAKTLQNAAI